MRAKDGAFLICACVLLVAIAGCAGAPSKPQADRAVVKMQEPALVEDSRVAPQAVEQTTPDSPKEIASRFADNVGETASSAPPSGAPPSEAEPKRVTALKPPTVRPAVMPEVVLSGAHADKCFIRVGDPFPDFRLPDLAGRAQTLEDLQAEGLAVVVFWSGDRLAAEDQLRYLNEHIARYADLGVRAVAINIGQLPDQVRAAVDALEVSVPLLLDLDGRLFSRIGKDHLPRTYLLDQDGRVLWFDIEFSRHTRENLEQAIHASLKST
ncbi:MAG: redoxin domain-containing protein [Pirellulales bacterium]